MMTNEEAQNRYGKNRHPSTLHMMRMIDPNPNLPTHLANIADEIFQFAESNLLDIEDGPELTAGLRKLLEAKDCFIRARLDSDPVSYQDR